MTAIISVVLVIGIFILAIKILPTIFIYALVSIVLAIQFFAKKFLLALSWIIPAVNALIFTAYALARQALFKEDAKALIAEKLPNQYNLRRRSFSLLIIELMIVRREFISPRLKGYF